MMAPFSGRRIGAVARKEWFHIRRDPFTLALGLAMPLLLVLLFGFAMDFNMREIRLAVSDSDKTQDSRRLVETFTSSDYFRALGASSPKAAVSDVLGERARAALIVPPRFQKDLLAGRQAQAQVLLDGADNSTVAAASQYVASIQLLAARRLAGASLSLPYELRPRFLFNPELDSSWFVVPGLTVVVMAILSILLPALTVAREWENGSMELLLSTPVRPLEIILGKAAPYAAIGALAVVFVYAIARTVFGVPFAGSLPVFALGCALFLVTYVAQGLLISTATRSQAVAMQVSMLSGMMPSTLLSGFVFPIHSMPKVFWYLTGILPARWFMDVSRGAFLRGSGLAGLRVPFLALGLSCALMVFLAARSSKRTLE